MLTIFIRRKASSFFLLLVCFISHGALAQKTAVKPGVNRLDLAGIWQFEVDSLDRGVNDKWFARKLSDQIRLPGSMTTNFKGNDIDVHTPWTGSIVDSSWYNNPSYARYRVNGNIKVPFWLQPVKYYKGPAWYQKEIEIPAGWKGSDINLFIERSHWETSVWVDDKFAGMANSLAAPDVFELGQFLSPGKHRLTVRIDNQVGDIDPGENSHSITDHTQGNWNGMVGKIFIEKRSKLCFADVQVFPDIDRKQITVKIQLKNTARTSLLPHILASVSDNAGHALSSKTQTVHIDTANQRISITYPMGLKPHLWDEFNPNLYKLKLQLQGDGKVLDSKEISFGMRKFSSRGTQFAINGRLTFLRGTLDCAAFPLTGYPPTDVQSWTDIFRKCKSYGLNHIRFHSWCPPEAAFTAADQVGLYLQIECSSWANQGATIGDGKPIDQFIYDESNRIVSAYGNHPSFCMLLYGNEPAGDQMKKYLTGFVKYWKPRDNRRLYTTGAGWPIIDESNYNSTPDPRIQLWGAGLKSVINAESPKTNFDWRNVIAKWQHPTVSHEIGQWCVYPDFSEISKYTGILKAKNFEIFRDQLKENGLADYASDFLNASGNLQVLCYKADIEAALRTPGFGGFQLLGLYDFPGQGTALVGVLNAFWHEKGYVSQKEYSRFCNAVVPLARFPKMVYYNDETLRVPMEIAQFGPAPIKDPQIKWSVSSVDGKVWYRGAFKKSIIPNGNNIFLGDINQPLAGITSPQRMIVSLSVNNYTNSWDIFVYPREHVKPKENILVTSVLDDKAIALLKNGGKVLWTLKQHTLNKDMGGDIAIGFSTIFWNTAWTHSQPPTTMGILCDPKHPALANFPTQSFSNWQWWDAMSHSSAMELDKIKPGLKPIVRVIDDWVTARSLGLIFECNVGKGKLIVSSVDLSADIQSRPEAKQLTSSLLTYMGSNDFKPAENVELQKLQAITGGE
ncbi:sugar-binding domain-containing protein [Mucilaginibacter pocheonensis]|uniref:beta-galactosidase n=1 Tax=Mucilaginibacter pocheonensis TaxID=398050 RepID=A0ABU1TGY0_9SPHI|nr:sugar-binding domain-containing protein [Mucilaginibacter pocheonensis]MDR6944056.1 hypothetical protein [Mucilaginibacter pocheonensis]